MISGLWAEIIVATAGRVGVAKVRVVVVGGARKAAVNINMLDEVLAASKNRLTNLPLVDIMAPLILVMNVRNHKV